MVDTIATKVARTRERGTALGIHHCIMASPLMYDAVFLPEEQENYRIDWEGPTGVGS